jgi:hypothetical protein
MATSGAASFTCAAVRSAARSSDLPASLMAVAVLSAASWPQSARSVVLSEPSDRRMDGCPAPPPIPSDRARAAFALLWVS